MTAFLVLFGIFNLIGGLLGLLPLIGSVANCLFAPLLLLGLGLSIYRIIKTEGSFRSKGWLTVGLVLELAALALTILGIFII